MSAAETQPNEYNEPSFSPTLPVVTLFESFGAGANRIGPAVAGELGVAWVEQQISSADMEAADRGTAATGLQRFYNAIARTHLGTMTGMDTPVTPQPVEQADQVRELTRDGAVILGRNATRILHGVPGVLHVKLDAPLADRLDRAVDTFAISHEVAARRAEHEDRLRAEMSLMTWNWDPRLTGYYDLVLNTSTFGEDRCVEIIVTLAREFTEQALRAADAGPRER